MSEVGKAARLAGIDILDRLISEAEVSVPDYGSGGKCHCETIIESEVQKAIDTEFERKEK